MVRSPSAGPSGTRYHIIKVLGVGGAVAVCRGGTPQTVGGGHQRSANDRGPRPRHGNSRSRFQRELLPFVDHRIAMSMRIHDLGEVDGVIITMTTTSATNLATWLKARADVYALKIRARSIVRGLPGGASARGHHSSRHKPANIVIYGDGEAVIVDFGIARSTNAPGECCRHASRRLPVGLRSTATTCTEATMSGSIIGAIAWRTGARPGRRPTHRHLRLGLSSSDMLAGRSTARRVQAHPGASGRRMERARADQRGRAPADSPAMPDEYQVH